MKAARTLVPLLACAALAAGARWLPAQIGPAQVTPAPVPAPPAPVSRAQADRHYAEKSYALALPEYQSLLTTLPPRSPDRTTLQYRVAVALGASQKWDAALAAWADFLAAHGTEARWAARAHYQRALLLDKLPHEGYKVGTKVYRGNDYPHVAGAEKPEYVWIQNDDMKAALADFEAAVGEYDRAGGTGTHPGRTPRLVPRHPPERGVGAGKVVGGMDLLDPTFPGQSDRRAKKTHGPLPSPNPLRFGEGGEERAGRGSGSTVFLQIKDPDGGYQNSPRVDPLAAEKTDLYFDLARFLPNVQPWGSDDDWKAAKSAKVTVWTIRPGDAYDPKWPQPKKVLYLLTRIPTLNPTNTHNTVLAELARGLYVAQSHWSWAKREYVTPVGHPEKARWQIVQTLPYFTLDPFPILGKAADTYPNDPQAPQIRLILAQWTENAGDFVGALKRYRALVARYPNSKWAPDARQAAQNIQRPTVGLSSPGPQHAGETASVTVNSRNLKTIRLRAYQVPLEAVLSAPGKLEDANNRLGDFTRNFGTIEAARKLGPQVAEWTQPTGDTGEFAFYGETLKTPLTKPGAYLIVADGQGDKVRAATVLLITDLAVMKKTSGDAVLCFVADARSGRPVPHAGVIVRQTWSDGTPHVQVGRGTTDGDGLMTVPTVKGQYNVQTEALASAPGDRYALTGQNYWWNGNNSDTRDEIKVYAYTDRPVYRPKQTVYFRQMLSKRAGGGSDLAPVVGTQVHVIVTSPKGDSVYDKTLTSSQFGTVNGSFDLPDGAALGEYNVSAQVLPEVNNAYTTGGSQFRVEEYKRPEYTVTVAPSTTQARFGDKVTATVTAALYSGPPVAGAKVAYKVFRSPYYPYYRFPQPYDWYEGMSDGSYDNQDASQGELVTQGSGVTDGKGTLAVSFTADKGTRGYSGDYAYTVMADVTDSSRRQISGEGVLHVTNQAFYAYLNVPNGFYHQGDKVQVELRTQNADRLPVSATGVLSVVHLTWEGGKTTETVVHTEDLTTDADGKAFTTWQSDAGGSYRLDFKARDKFEHPVVAQASVWVAGDEFDPRQFHTGGITLLTDKTTYEQGETAHLLIVSDQPDNWVLLTSETGNQILTRTLIHVPGRAKTVDVPIVRADVPNFAFAAAAVRDYKFYQWQQEVFVPPTRQFLHVAVSGDKAEYKPGDTGTFHVRATDYLGHPASAEVSLAVVDSSVYYIQKEYAPDVRLFLYGQRRYVNVNLDSSENPRMDGDAENDTPLQTFRPHGLVLPEVGRLPGTMQYPYYGPFSYDRARRLLVLGEVNSIGEGYSSRHGGGYGRSQFSISSGMAAAAPALPSFSLNGRLDRDEGILGSVVDEKREKSEPNSLYQSTGLLNYKPGNPFAPAQIRRNFSETAFWTPAVVTDKATGTATVTVHFPDTLTTWKATARGLTSGVLVGVGDTQAVTSKHLLVRLEAPRFFVERDRVTLSAIVRNDLPTAKTVRVSLAAEGGVLDGGEPTPARLGSPPLPVREGPSEPSPAPPSLTGEGAGGRGSFGPQALTLPAHSEKRVDWTARVVGDGQATVRMTAQTDEESDAVEQSFPALTYGVQKFLTTSGVLQAGQSEARLTVSIPKEHKAGDSALLVQINPSLAATTLDALPYLADYPYGCVEQTLSRFLPSVIVAHTLRDAGVDLDTLHKRALAMQERESTPTPFGQAAPTTHDTSQTGYTYPSGTPGVMKTALLADNVWHTSRWTNPVFDPAELQRMTDDGLSQLESMQQGDGGWGWWGGSSESDPYMTGYVVYGLATAKGAGVAVPSDVLARGYAWLAGDLKNRDDERDLAVWESFALSQDPASFPGGARRVVTLNYTGRDRLSAYGQALLALTLHNLGESEKAAVVCRNLRNTARIDAENGTASWAPSDRYWWNWYNNDVETDAWALKAYVAILPHDDLTPMLVKWLVQNQRGNAWHSTKETAMAVYALTDYVKANNELAPDYTVKVSLGDKIARTYTITRDNALLFDNRFLVPDSLLTDPTQTVTITKQGAGRLYYSTALQYFTTEENIAGSGTELKVQRRYFALTPKTKSVADYEGGTFNVLDYTRTELPDGASLKSGDMIEAELTLDSKNEYDYCVFEDMKPAGCEPLDLRSGGRYGDGLCSNMELRDTKTAFFVDHLPQGTRVLRYRLRAEVPGAFHALPANGYAVYAPDVRALSSGWHVSVGDAAPEVASAGAEKIAL